VSNVPHVCILTPTYDGRLTAAYMDSVVLSMQDPRQITSYRYHSGDSLVCRARNEMFTMWLREADERGWTHLLWQDGDVALPHGAVASMLSHDVDFIASPVPLKTNLSHHGWTQSVVGLIDEAAPMLYRVQYAATGCLMMSRKAVQAMADYCEAQGHVYFEGDRKVYDAFRIGSDGTGFYLSEDWYICKVMREELGFDLYVDSSFPVSHVDAPRHVWTRPAGPIAETIAAGDYTGELPADIRAQRWTTNDWEAPILSAN